MSRRPTNPAADRAAQNQQTLKNLVKLEGNKSCADCKRNKHPRWASWNLGVFICIRCSGIHRSMGTHISRVKSVDLDAWTDEQMKSVLQWGNLRANKYWEAKLAPGHVPSEAKIENFIRTKYESKRWVMDGPMPDPATLDADGDEDVPLGVVQEKQKLDRSSSTPSTTATGQLAQPPRPAQNVDLFGDDDIPAPRPRTTEPAMKPSAPSAPEPKPSKPADTLLGLDFFGPSTSSSGGKPAATAPASRGPASSSRPDLKQSILSLYASAPRQAQPAPVPQVDPAQARLPAAAGQAPQQPFGALSDAFSGLGFSSSAASPPIQQPKSSPFAQLGGFSTSKATPVAPQLTSSGLAGGGFFGSATKPSQTNSRGAPPSSIPSAIPSKTPVNMGGTPSQPTAPRTTTSSDLNSLLDISAPSAPPPPPKPVTSSSVTTQHSVFNLSGAAPASQSSANTTNRAPDPKSSLDANWGLTDAWASNDAWKNGDSATSTSTATSKALSPPAMTATADDFGWGGGLASTSGHSAVSASRQAPPNPPDVSADEDFGGWSSAVPVTPSSSSQPAGAAPSTKPGGGFGGSDDLFSNVWE